MINNILWADSSISSIDFDYDKVSIKGKDTAGKEFEVVCDGQVGLDVQGFWDEVIVEKAEIVTDHPFANECLKKVNTSQATGSPSRNSDANWSTLVITLIDGCQVICAAAKIEAN